MPKKFLDALQRWAKQGMHWPFVFDPQRNEPSVTLMFFYITFLMTSTFVSISSILQLIKGEYLGATVMPTLLFVLGFIFYRLRNLDKVKIDLDDREIELTDNDQEKDDNNASKA